LPGRFYQNGESGMNMLNDLTNSFNIIVVQTQSNLPILGKLLLILWLVFFFCRFIFPPLLLLGIIPRTLRGLPGIFFAPFLHANFNHLFFNSIPLVVLSNFILMCGFQDYLMISGLITVLSGLAIWCLGKPGLHIGASALVTGYWGFLVNHMYQASIATQIILGIVCLYYFAGLFFGIFPGKKGVSWEGHLFGLLAGFAVSTFFIGSSCAILK
jgi:membrane associated rhomboid family serine protease